MNLKKELGEKIKRVRKQRNLTQEELAEMIEISPRSFYFLKAYSDKELAKVSFIKISITLIMFYSGITLVPVLTNIALIKDFFD